MLRGIIFDIDGTLLDSNDAQATCWRQAMGENGQQIATETIRALIGTSADRILRETCGLSVGDGIGKAIATRRQQLFTAEHLPRCMATPGARALVQELRGRGLKLAIATWASSSEVPGLLAQAGLGELFEATTSADDVHADATGQGLIEAALGKLGLPARDVVLIGDTPWDVAAASEAGVRAIALRTGGWFDAELTGSAAVIEDPRELLLRLDVLYRVGEQPVAAASAPA